MSRKRTQPYLKSEETRRKMSEGLRGLNAREGERRCASCLEWFPEDTFKTKARGYRDSYCHPCGLLRQAKFRQTDKFKETQKRWQEKYYKTDHCKSLWRKSAARVRASSKGKKRISEYYANPEIKKAKSEYHAKRNQTERAKKQRRKNQEKYRKTPKGIAVMRAHSFRRKIAKLKTPVGDLKAIERWHVRWMLKSKVQCFWCREKFKPSECHADHIHPLIDGGRHAIDNLCISCASCNLRKHKKGIVEWNKKLREPALL